MVDSRQLIDDILRVTLQVTKDIEDPVALGGALQMRRAVHEVIHKALLMEYPVYFGELLDEIISRCGVPKEVLERGLSGAPTNETPPRVGNVSGYKYPKLI